MAESLTAFRHLTVFGQTGATRAVMLSLRGRSWLDGFPFVFNALKIYFKGGLYGP
jgi:hypothetical protein